MWRARSRPRRKPPQRPEKSGCSRPPGRAEAGRVVQDVPMQRGLVHALAWTLATGAAVTLTWWGVHTVMTGTAYDPPRAVPVSVGSGPPQRIGQSTGEPLVSSTHRTSPPPPPPPPPPPRRAPAERALALGPAPLPYAVGDPGEAARTVDLGRGEELSHRRRQGGVRARGALGEARLGDARAGLVDAGVDERRLDPGGLQRRGREEREDVLGVLHLERDAADGAGRRTVEPGQRPTQRLMGSGRGPVEV